MQQSLFSDYNIVLPKKNESLTVQVNKPKAVLSKEQQAFNRLTVRIKLLQEKIKNNTEHLTELNTYYHKKVTPEIIKLGEEKIKLSHMLHTKRKGEKLSAHLSGKLDKLIFQLLDDAFSVIEPDGATKELFAQYNDTSYDEELDAQKEDMVNIFSSMLFEKTGIKIDPEELKDGNPDFDRLENSIKEQLNNNDQKNRKKTKKQLQKEELEKQKEEIKNKSLRGIYISLAKILHPDKEPDENLRIEKEEYMKKVTTAYDNKDLMELLGLELLWVKDHEKLLENTPVDTLKVYIQLLKDQVKDLEYESQAIVGNPVYASVARYLFLNQTQAHAQIDRDRGEYIATHTLYAEAMSALEKNNRNRSVIVKCIEDFYFEEEDFPNFFTDAFVNFGKNSNRDNW